MSRKHGVLGLLVCLFLLAGFDIAIGNGLFESCPIFTSIALFTLGIAYAASIALIAVGSDTF